MKNVTIKQQGNHVTLSFDVTKDYGQSKSGKSTIVASTNGNVAHGTPDGNTIMIGFNAYRVAKE